MVSTHFLDENVRSTCNHAVSCGYTLEHLLDEPHFSACLQVTNTFLEDGREDAPNLGLTVWLTLLQELHHTNDALRLLDDEVHLKVKLTTDQLERETETYEGKLAKAIKKILHLPLQCVNFSKTMMR